MPMHVGVAKDCMVWPEIVLAPMTKDEPLGLDRGSY